ncbi:CatB-related O-acetyltransferase [Flavobacterium macacae]|nr:CatB-related O-acetyltransferase [Flavobacterium macacae]
MIKWLKVLNSIRVDLLIYCKRKIQAVEWRMSNSHNYTQLSLNVKNSKLISVGNDSYGTINVESFENRRENLIIGSFVSIAPEVTFVLGGNHQTSAFSTYPLKAYFLEKFSEEDAQTKGPIVVEDEVWIGQGCMIMSGVTLGKGCIVAAGSIVTKDVSPFAIVGGNPAKFIKWRIDENLIEKRKELSLSQFEILTIKDNIDFFYEETSYDSLRKLKKIADDNK